jgi:hypothetical protein
MKRRLPAVALAEEGNFCRPPMKLWLASKKNLTQSQVFLIYLFHMSPLFRIPIGLVVMVVGFYMVKNTDVLMAWFGRVPFAEDKLGAGGSRLFYKLLGIVIAFIGIFIATNVISDILTSTVCLITRC